MLSRRFKSQTYGRELGMLAHAGHGKAREERSGGAQEYGYRVLLRPCLEKISRYAPEAVQ